MWNSMTILLKLQINALPPNVFANRSPTPTQCSIQTYPRSKVYVQHPPTTYTPRLKLSEIRMPRLGRMFNRTLLSPQSGPTNVAFQRKVLRIGEVLSLFELPAQLQCALDHLVIVRVEYPHIFGRVIGQRSCWRKRQSIIMNARINYDCSLRLPLVKTNHIARRDVQCAYLS